MPASSVWNKAWSWVVVGTVVSLIIALAVTFMTSSHVWLGDIFFLLAGTLFLAKFFTWEDARQQSPAIRRRLSLIGLLTTVTLTIVALVGNHYLNRAKELTLDRSESRVVTNTELATVLLNCEMMVKPASWDNTLYVVETSPNLTAGFALITSTGGKPRNWPEEKDFRTRTYRCELTNYGPAAIFGLSTAFNFTFVEALKVPDNTGARKGGATVTSHEHVIEVPAIDGRGGTFVFYLHNQSEYFVNVIMPDSATVELSGRPERQRMSFKQPHPSKTLPFFLSPKID